MISRFLLFLFLNFAALFIGGFYTGDGVPSEWYQELNKAPWTPPGWVFGFAWTTIMICLAFYMSKAIGILKNVNFLILLYTVQLFLNILWNPLFFAMQEVGIGLFTISILTVLVAYILSAFRNEMKLYSLLLMPYCIWLIIATSLNAYIFIYN